MKKQIRRLSPHQNGKVAGVLMAVASLVFVIPMSVMFSLFAPSPMPGQMHFGPSIGMILLFPVMYLVFGYVMVAVACALYNALFGFLGGFEYESND
ncbi:hypothetical protein [Piscinibacterium candidicorallinum]|jgi:hypothetical protein|uniref:DUF3566 domain-containing protein n=1 Tax=Piscinibacterium candidicorallinum TaxID=1793872 RepID=A0ABV7H3H4_9BURK